MRRPKADQSLSRSGLIRANPFPGLRAFEPEEDHLFFGRETQIDELLRRLRRTRFLAVLGTSGSGKSSLVRSGLIPALYNGYMVAAGSSWRVALMRPGDDPMGNLATSLNHPEVLGGEPELADIQRELTLATLLSSGLGLAESVLHARIPADDNVLVMVDQFEELFRFKRGRKAPPRGADGKPIDGAVGDAVAFVELLLEAARQEQAPIYVVLTMRSDFIGNCMEFPGLPEAINKGLYLVPRMSRRERRLAITGPVAVGGARIAPRLVTRLLNDVGDDPDQLPILQHALMRTWSHWTACCTPDELIDVEDYEGIGTMSEALSRHAEGALKELDRERRPEIAERMFKALTEKDANNRGIRRPCRLDEVCAVIDAEAPEVIEVIECFRQAGRAFLMPPAGVPLDGDSIVDISHESLMRVWDRLIGWVEEEAESAQTYLRLSKAATFHEQGLGGLWRGRELQVALPWRERNRPTAAWARRYDPRFDRAMAFLEASRKTHEDRIARRQQQRRSKLRRTRWLAAVLGSAALLTLAFGIYALQLRDEALSQRAEAETQRAEAVNQKAEAERQKAGADAQRAQADVQRQIAEQARHNAERQHQLAEEQRQEALHQQALADRERRRAKASESEALDQKAKADRARDEANQQKERAEGLRRQAETAGVQARRLRLLTLAHALAVESSQLRRQDQQELAALLALHAYRLQRQHGSAATDPSVYQALLQARDRLLHGSQQGGVFFRHRQGAAIRAVAMAPDGRLAAGFDNGEVRLFDSADLERPPASLAGTGNRVRSLAIDGAGHRLAAGRFDGSIHLWDLRRPGDPPRVLIAHGDSAHDGADVDSVDALAFQDKVLASGSLGGEVKLWDLARPGEPGRSLAREPGGRVTAIAFSPGGATLAVGGHGVALWDPRELGAAPRILLEDREVRSLAYSADGRWLACGETGGTIHLRGVASGGESFELTGHQSSVNALSFSARHDLLASASSDHSVRLWNLSSPTSEPVVFADHGSWVWAVAFDPVGDRVFSGGADHTLRFWPTRSRNLAEELCRRLSRELEPEEWRTYLGADVDPTAACRPEESR